MFRALALFVVILVYAEIISGKGNDNDAKDRHAQIKEIKNNLKVTRGEINKDKNLSPETRREKKKGARNEARGDIQAIKQAMKGNDGNTNEQPIAVEKETLPDKEQVMSENDDPAVPPLDVQTQPIPPPGQPKQEPVVVPPPGEPMKTIQ